MRDPALIQSDLDAARVALRSAMTAQSYSLDSGQGKQSVTRASIGDLQGVIRDLENELEDASGSGGNFSATMERY
jgi:hypothetical protein